MNTWIKRLVILLEIGGGLIGLGIIGTTLLNTEVTAISVIVHIFFGVLFVFGIAAGVLLIKRPGVGLLLSQIYQGIQIPIITTSVVAYRMFCGATLHVYVGQGGFGGYLFFGSRYLFWLNGGEPWVVGVNILALAFFIFLHKQRKFEAAIERAKGAELSSFVQEAAQPTRLSWRSS